MPGKPFQSKYTPYLPDILQWRQEGKTFEQIANLLPPTLRPNGRVICDLIKRHNKRKSRDRDLVTIPITIRRETLNLILETLAAILIEKKPAELRQFIQEISARVEIAAPQASRGNARANSDKALALAAKLKAEQTERAQRAALKPLSLKLTKDKIDLPPLS